MTAEVPNSVGVCTQSRGQEVRMATRSLLLTQIHDDPALIASRFKERFTHCALPDGIS